MSIDSIKGSKYFILRTGDSKVPFDVEITECSADGANDGFLSYGATDLSVDSIWTTNAAGTMVSGIINGTPTITSNRIELDLDYPTELGAGNYSLYATINYTVSSTARKKTLLADKRIKVF